MPGHLNDNDGMGLRNMRYRARMIGAELNFSAGDSAGTRVSCSLKL